jgi:hypothetical protein
MSTSTTKITKQKSADEILNPQPIGFDSTLPATQPVEVRGEKFKIYPMPDGVIMTITDSISQIIAIVDSVVNFSMPTEDRPEITPALIIPILPKLINILLPNSTKLIAAALRKDEEWVQDNLNIAKRLEALRLILVAEDIPLILKNWQALVSVLTPAPEVMEKTS